MRAVVSLLLLGVASSGCLGEVEPVGVSTGGRLAVTVAPLSLAGVVDADYTVTVTNAAGGAGDVVWTRALTSSDYGDGAGSLAYVGPCDAAAGVNTVILVLDALHTAGGPVPLDGYVNPTPIQREVVCAAGADVAVTFDVTIARRAEQGFFDVAVEFGDLFCSAKLDCVDDATGGDLELLFNALGARDMTAVLGFACAAGPETAAWLYLDDPVITCAGLAPDVVRFEVSGLGNVDLAAPPSANPGGYLFAASVFRGTDAQARLAYWNVAFGLNEAAFAAAGACVLTARATASDAAWEQVPGGFAVPMGRVYPTVAWEVPLSGVAGRTCGRHEVDVADSGVATAYVGHLPAPNRFVWSSEPVVLRHRFDAALGVVRSGCAVDCPVALCGADGVCDLPTCDDAWANGDETDVDCGGADCGPCGDGRACVEAADCASGVCVDGVCAAPACDDGVANGDETDADCGGAACGPCDDGDACAVGGDCASGVCVDGVCAAPACDDEVANGDETDVDCGGAACGPCGVGAACGGSADCASGACGVGAGGTCEGSVCSAGAPLPTGEVLTCERDGGAVYQVRTFSAVGSSAFVAPAGVTTVDVLVVGGGGGGGGSSHSLGGGGGGGAGGLLQASGVAVTPGASYPVVVGAGGAAGNAGPGGNGGASSALGLTTVGGGGGGSGNTGGTPSSGGSGGGAGYNGYNYRAGASGTSGQGYAGGANICSNYAGGGGGAGGPGQDQVSNNCGAAYGRPVNGGLGGPGLTLGIGGVPREYARGGDGSIGAPTDGVGGAPATGGGGHGSYAAANGNRGGAGGSGVVIIRHLAP